MTVAPKQLPAYGFFAILIAIVVLLHVAVDRRVKLAESATVNVPAYSTLHLCSLGYDRFLSDIYYLAFVQYTGDGELMFADKYAHAYSYVDLITRLDPHFQQPYWFGCWVIGSTQKRPDLADKIMQRGIEFNPNSYYMPFLAGINQFLYAHNYQKAAAYYHQSAQLPGAPPYVARQALILASPIPEQEKRMRTLRQLYATAKDDNLKESARKELIGVLKDMYRSSPVATVKASVKGMLLELGVDESEINSNP